jgi:hypothetical protein
MFTLRPSDRIIDICTGALLVLITVAGMREASARPFWYDEIFTVLIAQLPDMSAVLAALGQAADTSGPVFYVLVRMIAGMFEPELAFRLVPVLASTIACAALYAFARRDLGATAGLTAVLVMMLTSLHHGYDVEARPYSLMVMFIAIAAVAWQRASSWGWVLVLAIAAALAVGTHYYSIFAGVPFAIAEIVYTVRRRHVRLRVWAAFGMGVASLALCWPLLQELRDYYGAAFHATATIGRAVASYDEATSIGRGVGFGIAFSLGFAMLLLFVRLWPKDEDLEACRPAPETLAFVMSLLAVPFIAVVISQVMNGGFTPRYALGMLAGVGLSFAYASRALDSKKRTWLALGLLAIVASRELAFWASPGDPLGRGARARFESQQQALERAKQHGLPIVVDNALDCLPLAFYDSDPPARQAVCLADPEAARRYISTDSLDLDLLALRPFVEHPIVEFAHFRQLHPEFLLLSHFGGESWWPSRLVDDRFTLTVIERSADHALYRVQSAELHPN